MLPAKVISALHMLLLVTAVMYNACVFYTQQWQHYRANKEETSHHGDHIRDCHPL